MPLVSAVLAMLLGVTPGHSPAVSSPKALPAQSGATVLPNGATAQQAPDDIPHYLLLQVDPAHRMTVPISIGANGPYQFFVDTGAEKSAVSQELAQQLQLQAGASRTVLSFGGMEQVQTMLIPSLRFAKVQHRSINALAFGRSRIGGDGFLGIDTLAGKKVTFDFARNRIVVRSGFRRDPRGGGEGITVDTSSRNGRLIFSEARANRVSFDAILDTGTSISIGNVAMRDALIARGRLRHTLPVYLLAITGELMKAEYTTIDEVQLDGVRIHNLPIAFATTEPFARLGLANKPAMLLGIDGLRAFQQVDVDFVQKRVRFVPNEHRATFDLFFS